MLSWLSRWSRALRPGQRRKPPVQRREQSPDLYPTLQVRMLEERRVFHGGAVVAPTEAIAPPPPPPPTTTVSLDAGQNLLVQDTSATGQNDQLSVRLDAEHGRYEIYDPTQLLQTNIEGATGSGTNRIYIPVEVVTGNKLIFQTGAGDDSLAVDLSGGLGGKSLVFDGGAGQHDSLSLSGGSYSAVGYLFGLDGSTQIQFGPTQLQLWGVEPIFDSLTADTRQFTIGAGLGGMSLADDGVDANGLSQLTTSLGTSVTFASPLHSLTLAAQESGTPTLAVTGLDAAFAGDLNVNAADGNVELSGQLNLQGGSLRASGDAIRASGSIVTHDATIELSARSTLTVTADGVLENSAGRVLLDAGEAGTLKFSGRIDARGLSAGQTGGTVHLLGRQVEMLGTASIDASGHSGGGTVLVGGDYQGLNPLIRTTTNTLVQAETSIKANALTYGNGGTIIVWADDQAIVAGSGNLQAKGGATGGDGGFIETSGKRYLEVRDAADASSPFGHAGTWLLDPINLTVVTTISGGGSDGQLTAGAFTSSVGDTEIAAATIVAALQGGTDVTLTTGGGTAGAGNLTVNAAITVAVTAATTRTLTLNAHGVIDVNQSITATGGRLNIALNANLGSGRDAISLDGNITIDTNGGNFSTVGTTFENTDATIDTRVGNTTVGGNVTLNHTGLVQIANPINAGDGTVSITGVGIDFEEADGTISAQIANLNAGTGAITSAGSATNDIVVTGTNAAISLAGASLGSSANRMRVDLNGGTLALTATGTAPVGDIYVDLTDGDFNTSDLTTLSAAGAGADIVLRVLNGDFNIDVVSQFAANTTNDDFTLVSDEDDINISLDLMTGTSLSANTIVLAASDGSILATTAGPHLKTAAASGTAITLLAAGKIGNSGTNEAIGVEAGAGVVTASIASNATTDGIYLASTGPLSLGAISTGTGIQTVRVSTTGAAAHLTITASSTTNDNWSLNSAGDISFSDAFTVSTNSLDFTAVGDINLGAATATSANAATLDAGDDIDLGTGNLSADSLTLDATGDINLASGTATSTDAAALTAGGNIDFGTAGSLSADSMTLDATGDILFGSGSASSTNAATLTAGGNIDFGTAGSLTAGSATLTATGSILSSAADATDIDSSSADGTITLTAAEVGAAGQPLQLAPGAGDVVATATTGGLAIQFSAGNLLLSQLTLDVQTAGQTIEISTKDGDITFDDFGGLTNTDDDDWVASAGGTDRNILYTSSAAFVSELLTLRATGNIGASGAEFLTQATGTFDISAGGDVYLRKASGDLATGEFTNLESTKSGGGFVSIGTLDGDVTIDDGNGLHLSDDTLQLVARKAGAAIANINFETTLTVGRAELDAEGNINSDSGMGAGLDIDAAGGIALVAGGGIGASGNRLEVDPGSSTLSATTSGADAAGDIYLQSAAALNLSGFTTDAATTQTVDLATTAGDISITSPISSNDNWMLSASANISFGAGGSLSGNSVSLTAAGTIDGGGTLTDITTAPNGSITLTGTSVGASTALQINPGTGAVNVTATSGGVGLVWAAGDLVASNLTLDVQGANQRISLSTTDGSFTFDDLSTFTNTGDDDFVIETQGTAKNIEFAGTFTLVARNVSLTATGSIVSGGAAADLDVTGNITLVSGNGAAAGNVGDIGASGNELRYEPAGNVSATADGDIYLRQVSGNLLTNSVTTLTSTKSGGGLVSLGAISGAVNVNGTSGWSLADDTLEIVTVAAAQDITLNATITAGAVRLLATGAIVGNVGGATDINTSAANGTITLSGTSLGATGTPLQLNSGATGLLNLTASTGGVLVQFDGGPLHTNLVTLSVAGVNQHVEFSTTGNAIEIDGVAGFAGNTADDDFFFSTGGTAQNITFSGASTTLTGRSVSLTASGNIVSGTATTDIVSTGGDISLVASGNIGGSGNELLVQSSANLYVVAGTAGGDIYLRQVTGSLATSKFTLLTSLRANGFVSIGTLAGSVNVDSTTGLVVGDDRLQIVAGGASSDITFGATLIASHVELNAGRNIQSAAGAANDVVAPGGLDLIAGGGIGSVSEPLLFQTGNGLVTAATLGSGAAGNIYLLSDGNLRLGAVTTDTGSTQEVAISAGGAAANLTLTQPNASGLNNSFNDDWTLGATGDIAFGAAGQLTANSATLTAAGQINGGVGASTDIDTSAAGGPISLTAASLGTTTRLQLNSGTALTTLVATTGGLFATFDGAAGLTTSRLALNVAGIGQTISLHAATGPIVFDSTAQFDANTQDDNFQLQTLGTNQNVSFTGAPLVAQSIDITATGSILGGVAGTALQSASGITLSAGDDIGTSGSPLVVEAVGQLFVTADDDIYVRVGGTGGINTSKFGLLTSTGVGSFVSVGTVDGAVTVDNTSTFLVANDTLEIVAGTTGDITLAVPVTAGSVRLIAAGSILSTSTAPTDVVATGSGGTSGDIVLVAGGGIADSANPLAVSAAGNISAQTSGIGSAGDIYLTSAGALSLNAMQTDTGSTQTVSLTTTTGNFTIAAPSVTNDNWIINSAGTIAFSGTGHIQANGVDLIAAGAITGGTAAIDIDTSQGNGGAGGSIGLRGTSIGDAANALVLRPGGGQLSVTATTGNVYLEFPQSLQLGQFTVLDVQGTSATLGLNVTSGDLTINRSLGDAAKTQTFNLTSSGAIVFDDDTGGLPPTLIANTIALTATGDIRNFSSQPLPPPPTMPPTATVQPTANLAAVGANASITLTGRGLGDPGQPLQVAPGAGQLTLNATQDIHVNVVGGDIVAARLHVLATGGAQNVLLSTSAGSIELDADSFTGSNTLALLSATARGTPGNIQFGDSTIAVNNLTLQADGSIISGPDSGFTPAHVDATVTGMLTMTALGGDIGAAGNALTFNAGQLTTDSSGSQFLSLPTALSSTRVVSVNSGRDITLHAGRFLMDGTMQAAQNITAQTTVLLGGSGNIIAPQILVQGQLSPGFFDPISLPPVPLDGDASQLTLTGTVTVADTGSLIFDINPPYDNPGVDYDHINVVGTLNLLSPELVLRGASDLQQSINGLSLVSATLPVQGMFEITGSPLSIDRTGNIKASVGNFSGKLIVNGPTGPGIVIGELSLVPPLQRFSVRLPPIRLPVFTTLVRPLPPSQPPPPLPPPSPPPPLKVESPPEQLRYLEVRIVVPIDDAGNVREEVVMQLPPEMLTDLPALLRRLPDDRYRIYLMQQGSAEERLVIDVLVRDGRPMEPADAAEGAALPELLQPAVPPPLDDHHSGAAEAPALPELPARSAAPLSLPAQGARHGNAGPGDQVAAPAAGRLFAGMGLAVAAVVASRSPARWSEQVDEAAEQIGSGTRPFWRWWRSGAAATKDASRNN